MTDANQTTAADVVKQAGGKLHPRIANARRWQSEWDEEVKRDWDKGTSILEFARRFDVKQKTVQYHARRLGLR